MKQTTARLLRQLLEHGTVRRSQVSRTAHDEIQPLINSGAIREERAGAGSCCRLIDPAAVAGVLEAARPQWNGAQTTAPRANAVRTRRDAKRTRSDSPEVLLLRSCRDTCVWSNGAVRTDVAALTRGAGVAAIAVRPDDHWQTTAPLGMIENKEVFWHCGALLRSRECGSFLYYAGNVPVRLTAWLASARRTPRILFYPDYDPVGLGNYLAVKDACGTDVELVIPEGFEALLEGWGKRELLADNTRLLDNLLDHGDETVRRLICLMQRHGCGLEQEILLTLDQ